MYHKLWMILLNSRKLNCGLPIRKRPLTFNYRGVNVVSLFKGTVLLSLWMVFEIPIKNNLYCGLPIRKRLLAFSYRGTVVVLLFKAQEYLWMVRFLSHDVAFRSDIAPCHKNRFTDLVTLRNVHYNVA